MAPPGNPGDPMDPPNKPKPPHISPPMLLESDEGEDPRPVPVPPEIVSIAGQLSGFLEENTLDEWSKDYQRRVDAGEAPGLTDDPTTEVRRGVIADFIGWLGAKLGFTTEELLRRRLAREQRDRDRLLSEIPTDPDRLPDIDSDADTEHVDDEDKGSEDGRVEYVSKKTDPAAAQTDVPGARQVAPPKGPGLKDGEVLRYRGRSDFERSIGVGEDDDPPPPPSVLEVRVRTRAEEIAKRAEQERRRHLLPSEAPDVPDPSLTGWRTKDELAAEVERLRREQAEQTTPPRPPPRQARPMRLVSVPPTEVVEMPDASSDSGPAPKTKPVPVTVISTTPPASKRTVRPERRWPSLGWLLPWNWKLPFKRHDPFEDEDWYQSEEVQQPPATSLETQPDTTNPKGATSVDPFTAQLSAHLGAKYPRKERP